LRQQTSSTVQEGWMSNGATEEADRRAAERRKLTAEIEKLEAEKLKIEAEIEKLTNDQQGRQATSPRAHAEWAKLEAETAKLKAEELKLKTDRAPDATSPRSAAEIAKLEAEKLKLESERRKIGYDVYTEWGKTIGAFLIGIGAILTFGLGFCTRVDEKDARFRGDAARLVENLSSDQTRVRTAAAIGLRSFLNSDSTRAFVVDGLSFALGLESERAVQLAMADSLAAAGSAAVPALQKLLVRVNGEVRIGLSNLGQIVRCSDRAQDLAPVRAKQSAMMAAALALERTSRMPGAAQGPAFLELNFKCFELYGVANDLRGAVFRNAVLWDADFYGIDLRDSDFTKARAWGASFKRAMLTGADFAGSELDDADFTEAIGLTEAQVKAAKSSSCAKFDAPLAAALSNEIKPQPGKVCPP
jgi:hypothetical protein